MTDSIQCLKEILSSQSSIIFTYLFGSRVKGCANENSDWDIAVYFSEPLESIGLWPAFELEAKLSRAVGATVQVAVLNNHLSPIFGFKIVSEGILLSDKNTEMRIDFENRVLRYYYDWQYFLKRQILAEKSVSPVRNRRDTVINTD
jgi:predicted nucleotidyltransferase